MKKTFIVALALGVSLVFANTLHAQTPPAKIKSLLDKYGCLTCHKVDKRLVGPSYVDISKQNYSDMKIVELIWRPQNNWESKGYPLMLPLPQVAQNDGLKIAKWINSLKTSK